MVKKVFGRIDGITINLEHTDGDMWTIPVSPDEDGQYVVEMIAEDEAGNQSYIARMLYTITAGDICISLLPLPKYRFCLLEGYQMQNISKRYDFDLQYPTERGVAV